MKRGLVIEDNEDNMMLITRLLKKAGYEHIWAPTGCRGLEMVAEQPPDFILLDIQLPDIDGTEVLRRLRLTEVGKAIPVIVVTSYAMAGDREQFLAAGANAYLEKPIDPLRVIDQIRAVVGE
ncbi:MAG: response regulator [Veillonellaceae bacterium]|nr:response regulator [Veillonellaceae bacterium]